MLQLFLTAVIAGHLMSTRQQQLCHNDLRQEQEHITTI